MPHRLPGLRAQETFYAHKGVSGGLFRFTLPAVLSLEDYMTAESADPASWDPTYDAVTAAPKHHKVIFENKNLRVLEVTLHPNDEEPIHHHRWPSVFVFDQIAGPVHDIAPDGTQLPPRPDVMQALKAWNGEGCLVVQMTPQPLGRVHNGSTKTIHGIRIEMKN